MLAVGGFVALLLFVRQGGAGDAEHDGLEIGECLTESAEVVSCGSGEARFRVLGNAGWWSQTDYDNEPAIGELCEAYPTYETSFWIGDASGDSGEVVCVESVTP